LDSGIFQLSSDEKAGWQSPIEKSRKSPSQIRRDTARTNDYLQTKTFYEQLPDVPMSCEDKEPHVGNSMQFDEITKNTNTTQTDQGTKITDTHNLQNFKFKCSDVPSVYKDEEPRNKQLLHLDEKTRHKNPVQKAVKKKAFVCTTCKYECMDGVEMDDHKTKEHGIKCPHCNVRIEE
jgi:DNA-directed RNA polymerase subunit RPC12/RpoP